MNRITKRVLFAAVALVSAVLLQSCLTCEFKEYTFNISSDGNSGQMTIVYQNIMSQMSDENDDDKKEDVSDDDFVKLMEDYWQGTKVEDDFPDATLVSKDLYEQDEKLWGKIVFKFNDLEEVKLYRYDDKSPIMHYSGSYSESYHSTNGTRGPEFMPVTMWDSGSQNLILKNKVDEEDEEMISLLKLWKKKGKKYPR